MNDSIKILGNPFFLMAKPVGSSCNLACSYCYYLGKGGKAGQIDPPAAGAN